MVVNADVVVTHFPALTDYLREIGLADEKTKTIECAQPQDIEGKIVVGVIPFDLAALANLVILVPLDIPDDLEGKELSVEEVKQYAGKPAAYVVNDITDVMWT